jgi:hypothetical protein
MKWLRVSLLFVVAFLTGNVSWGATTDEEIIKEGIKKLNQLILQNQINDLMGQHHLNQYVLSLDETHAFEKNGKFLKKSSTLIELENSLKALALEGIDFYVILNAERYEAYKKDGAERITQDAVDKIKVSSNAIMQSIFDGSVAKAKNNGKNALLGITPIVKLAIGTTQTADAVKFKYVRIIRPGSAFPMLHEVMRIKYNLNEEKMGLYSKDPDAAIKSHTLLYSEIMKNYAAEVAEVSPLGVKGFALEYYNAKKGETLTAIEKEYFEKTCLLFDKMGISLSSEYLKEIKKENIDYLAGQLVKGDFPISTKPTYQALYEKLSPKYNGFLRLITDLQITKNADRSIAIISSFNKAEMQNLSLEQRCNALRYLHTTDLNGGFIFKGGEEYVIDLIKETPQDQVYKFLQFISEEQVTNVFYTGREYRRNEKTTSLIYALLKNFDDWGFSEGSNYQELIKAFKHVIIKSNEALIKYTSAGENFSKRVFLWKKIPFLGLACDELSVKDSDYSFKQEENGEISVTSRIVKRKDFAGPVSNYSSPTENTDTKIKRPYNCSWEDIPTYKLKPFDIVTFVDVTNTSIVDAGSGEYYVPAMFLEFIADQKFKEDVLNSIALAADIALIATGPGTIITAIKAARWGIVAWEFANVIGAAGNIYALTSSDPDVQRIVTTYNVLVLGFGIVKGTMSVAKKFDLYDLSKVSENGYTYSQTKAVEDFSEAWKNERAQAKLNSLTSTSDKSVVEAYRKTHEYLEAKGLVKSSSVVVANKLSAQLNGSFKKIFDFLISKGIAHTDDGKVIVFSSPNEVLAELTGTKLTPKKWTSQRISGGELVFDTEEGYSLIKRGENYAFELGYKGNRSITATEVNSFFKAIGKNEPYKPLTQVIDRPLLKGEKVYIVENLRNRDGIIAPNPGAWGSRNRILSEKELRSDLAVLEAWKKSNGVENPLVVREYTVKESPRVRDGVIGPQQEIEGTNIGEVYYGGEHQYEFFDYIGGENWKKYFDENPPHYVLESLAKGGGNAFKVITTDIGTALRNRVGHIRKIVFEAKSNGTYRFSGGHSKSAIDELGANARIEITIPKNAEGVYEAKVFAKGPDGKEIVKSGNGGKSTFYPDHWDEAKILEEAEFAVKNNKGLIDPTDATKGYYGFSKDGKVKIGFYYRDTDGYIGSFFPILNP